MLRIALFVSLTLWLATASALGVEHLTIRHEGKERTISGKLVVEATDGSVFLLQTSDNRLWQVLAKDLIKRDRDDVPFKLDDKETLAKQLQTEFPGFRIHHTKHYVICYNTSRAYAEWCGTLYERVYTAYYKYWGDLGLKLDDPPAPLVALLFEDFRSYSEYAKADIGGDAPKGYYYLFSNRITTYDMTGVEGATLGDKPGLSARINTILSRPGAEQLVATIVHEATHQLTFNSGMHKRMATIPRWLSEGMAIYFETPDLKNARGWNKIGAVNQLRLLTFRQSLASRPADSLAKMISSDDRFVDVTSGPSAYAEAWAFTYFLSRVYPKQYAKYLAILAAKEPLLPDSPEEKLKDFETAFGADLAKLDEAFKKYMAKVK